MDLVKELTELRDRALDQKDFWSVKLLTKVIERVGVRQAKRAAQAGK